MSPNITKLCERHQAQPSHAEGVVLIRVHLLKLKLKNYLAFGFYDLEGDKRMSRT